jgi:membrane protease YdiL (CAAX protease family)
VNDKPPPLQKLPTNLALLVALAGPPLFALLGDQRFGEFASLGIQVVLQLLYCALAGFVVWVVVRQEHLPLRSIGVQRPDWSTLVSGVLLCGVVLYVLPLMTAPLLNALGTDGLQARLQQLAPLPVWFRVIVGVTGGIVEETLYRGYALERFATITGRRWLGGTISVVAFGLAHIPAWGIGFALGADLPFGIVMTGFYLWKRDLLANILAHSTGLVVAMLTTVQ